MQEKTINNALLALRKQGGPQAMLAEVLLDMRGVHMPEVRGYKPIKHSPVSRAVRKALENGPQTTIALTEAVLAVLPGITRRSAYNRAYQALLRLEERGKVVRCGDGVWRLATSNTPPGTEQSTHSDF